MTINIPGCDFGSDKCSSIGIHSGGKWICRNHIEHALAEKDAHLAGMALEDEQLEEGHRFMIMAMRAECDVLKAKVTDQARELERLKQEREDCWLRFAATGTHEDFLVSLDTCLLSEFEQGEKLKAIAQLATPAATALLKGDK